MNDPQNDSPSDKDFWDLGDDDLELPTPPVEPQSSSSPPAAAAANDLRAELTPIDEEDKKTTPIPHRTIVNSPVTRAAPIPMESAPGEPEAAAALAEVETQAQTERRRVVHHQKPTSLLEKVAIGVFFVCLLGAAAWGLANYYSQAPEGKFVALTEDFPVTGEHLQVEEIESWWRYPIRKGPNADRGIQLTAELIPCVKIRISGTENAALRYAFVDHEGQIVGDSPTLEVRSGKFVTTDSNEIEVHCTGGFREPSLINSYVNGDIKPWLLQLFEASAGEIPKQVDSPLTKSRIDASFRENED